MLQKFFAYLHTITDLRPDTDIRGTISSIKKGITISGYNVWILGAAAIIASIGLDVNSPAVIIGAMLISPLMSPILGVGLSVAINDRDTLAKSLQNLGIAVGASLLMSFLYFLVTPFGEATPEILGRTHPTLLDVGVAFFGGVAGIVAGSRKDKTNAIPGVAIATALMPPLCVAGYGLAKAEWDIFLGAFYLFFINATFISISTYLIVRLLRFPYVDFVEEETKRKVQRLMLLFVLIIIGPSVYFLYDSIVHIRTNHEVERFVDENLGEYGILRYEFIERDSISLVKAYTADKYVEDSIVTQLQKRLPEYGIKKAELQLVQLKMSPSEWDRVKTEMNSERLQLMEMNKVVVDEKQERITALEARIDSIQADTIPFGLLTKEMPILFPNIKKVSFAETIERDFEAADSIKKTDTIPTFFVEWNKKVRSRDQDEFEEEMQDWLRTRLSIEKIRVRGL